MILSLQGCMAVGKTTAVQYLREHLPEVHISYEDNQAVIRRIKEKGLDKNCFADYIQIQRMWIENEILRWRSAQPYAYTIMDFGAEEIEFYTLNYPKSIGEEWDVETALEQELEQLRKCLPHRILFLDADEAELRKRKEKDDTRSRTFFEHHVKYLLPLKKAWFSQKEDVDILDVNQLTKAELGEAVKAWVLQCVKDKDIIKN